MARSIVVETALLSVVRVAYFVACRHYVNASLFSDLKSVIRSEDGALVDDDDDAGAGAGGGGGGGGDSVQLGDLMKISSSSSSLPLPATTPTRHDQSSSSSPMTRRARMYATLSSALFCVSFSESSTLFTLLLFGEAVSEQARTLNWSFSLLTLLALIVFVIPLGLCLLLTYRTRTTFGRTLLLTLVPFSLYLLTFYRFGHIVASKAVVAGSHSIGLVNTLLSRICVPGVVLIASLSGGGAINTAWEAYEWRSVSSAEPVTDAQILQAERALYAARLDLEQRERALRLARGSAERERDSHAAQSLLSRLATSTSSSTRRPAAQHVESLEVERGAMQRVERQMVDDVATLKRRKAMREMGRSWKGRLWLSFGWLFSLYCVWRVFVSCINLVFGYSRQSHQRNPDGAAAPGGGGGGGTDIVTSLLTRVVVMLDIELDVATWSRLIGLVLIGGIILANMRNVLASVSRIFKATSTGISASFMLLFLAQLMAIYLLTSLISLPSSPTPETTTLLDTLPDFNVFSRLFDSVFLLAAATLFVSRFAHRKLRDDEGVSSQYS
ncbi:hypothetical protein JCM3766R1_007147 [Sporobolomyces carnicolor]